MKKTIVFVCTAFLLAAAAVAVFIAAFDANRWRPFLERQLTEALGKPVTLGNLDLTFHGGFSLEVERIVIGEKDASGMASVFRLNKASFMIRFAPLLRRSLEIGAVKLEKPELHLIRYRDGSFGIEGLSLPAGKSVEGSSQSGFSALPLLVDAVWIEDGNILVRDELQQWFGEIQMKDLDIELKEVSFLRPIRFRIRTAVFGERQNIDFSGRFRIPAFGRPSVLEDAKLQVDFGGMNQGRLFKGFPALRALGLREGIEGGLTVCADDLELPGGGFSKLKGQVRFENGNIPFAGPDLSVRDIDLDAEIRDDAIRIKNLSASVLEGKIGISGSINHPVAAPVMTLNVSADRVRMDSFFRPSAPGGSGFQGRLSVSFQGTAEGFAWPRIARTLSGNGRLGLENGVILNFNILREVFNKLSFFPGLVETLMGRLSPSDQIKLQSPNTVFEPIDFPVSVKEGALSTDRLRLATDSLEMTGSARLSFDGILLSQSMLRIYPGFSKALTQSVKELEYLLFADGWMGFPVKIQGKINHPSFIPDVNYIGVRLAVNKTQEVLGGLFEKALSKGSSKQTAVQQGTGQTVPATGTGTSSGTGFPYEELLSVLFEPDEQTKSKGQ